MKYHFLILALLFSVFSGCGHWSQMQEPTAILQEPTDIFVSAINFVPVSHPRFINKRVKLAKHNRELATYYEYALGEDLRKDFIPKTIYENKEHEGRLVITPYSRLSITLSDNSRLATFFKEHTFELTDENSQVVPTYNDYKSGQFHVGIQGMESFIKDSIVIQPKAYLGGGLVESINKVYTLNIIHKPSKRTIFAKECITLFEASPFLLLQICVVPKGWEGADSAGDKEATDAMRVTQEKEDKADRAGDKEATLPKYYTFHPEYYHWVRRGSFTYDSYYFNTIVGKSYTKGYSQFPIRVEIHPDAPNYAQGWMAYGDGLKAEIDKILETIEHKGILREVYHLYHTEHQMAPLFGWKKWSGENKPYYSQVINADAGGGMRQRVRINEHMDYNHEVGHTFALGHNAGSVLLYTWRGYNSFCYQKILPYFYEIKGTKGKGVLRKSDRGTWAGDSQNVIILRGGFHRPITKIKTERVYKSDTSSGYRPRFEDRIILPTEKINPVEQSDALYFFEPDQSGQYKLTFFYTPVNGNVYGDMVVKVHAESIEGTEENVSDNPNVKVSTKKTQVRGTVMLTAKNPIAKNDDKFSLQNMTFQKGRSYAIFIHYEMTEDDDKKFEKGHLVFQGVEVTKQ
ncbi:hypothetical protein C6501_11325 [Candidatus Poribacteria bacterium]|nr:MAG: hypothetical protein C6501_11325 [Candidatus Poribacteria bacterium]